jgi:transposase-like protein
MLGIRPSTFYRWCDRYRSGGPEALEDRPSKSDRVWNRIPDDVRRRIVAMALDVPELSPRELATLKAILSRNLRSIACSRPTT